MMKILCWVCILIPAAFYIVSGIGALKKTAQASYPHYYLDSHNVVQIRLDFSNTFPVDMTWTTEGIASQGEVITTSANQSATVRFRFANGTLSITSVSLEDGWPVREASESEARGWLF